MQKLSTLLLVKRLSVLVMAGATAMMSGCSTGSGAPEPGTMPGGFGPDEVQESHPAAPEPKSIWI